MTMKAMTKAANTQPLVDAGSDRKAAELINGLDFLIAEAESQNLRVPAKIIIAARSDLLHWAINDSPAIQDKSQTKSPWSVDRSGLILAIDLVSQYASLKDDQLKKRIMDSLKAIRRSQDRLLESTTKRRA